MKTGKVFMSGRSQAVRLPKEYRFKCREVQVRRIGDTLILSPRRKGWDRLEEILGGFTEDFMAGGRNQPEKAEEREPLS